MWTIESLRAAVTRPVDLTSSSIGSDQEVVAALRLQREHVQRGVTAYGRAHCLAESPCRHDAHAKTGEGSRANADGNVGDVTRRRMCGAQNAFDTWREQLTVPTRIDSRVLGDHVIAVVQRDGDRRGRGIEREQEHAGQGRGRMPLQSQRSAGGTVATLSIAAILAESAQRYPDRVAVVLGPQKVTYEELWREVRLYATVLRDRGIGPGDRVALIPNVPDFPRFYYAVLSLGAVVVPVHALLRPEEIEYVLRDSALRCCARPDRWSRLAPRAPRWRAYRC